jgi:hypothetical protein
VTTVNPHSLHTRTAMNDRHGEASRGPRPIYQTETALSQSGYRLPEDFLHLVFPLEEHDEQAWGRRLHIPVQLGLSPIAAAGRGRFI